MGAAVEATQEAADAAEAITEKVANLTSSGRRMTRELSLTCAEFSAKVAEFADLDLEGKDADAIKEALKPFDRLEDAVVAPCTADDLSNLQESSAKVEAKAAEFKEQAAEAEEELEAVDEQLEALKEKLEGLEEELNDLNSEL